ncbi:MAG: ATP phosphoribosyltransferase regulatory subunit [Cyanobacteria bacterium SZAS TMP-1]|nr:ATP phosphoribosyltransferase regulatory subunit [Cyanobacteria bacterium SZAS TMP-1]
MSEDISKRIAAATGVPHLSDILAQNLTGADLHSLLLMVLKQRVAAVEPAELTRPSPVTEACGLDGRLLNAVECRAYRSAPDFAAIELSPLVSLGAVNVLTNLDQGNVLSTIRGYECASDPTVGLALHSVGERKSVAARQSLLRLCTSQRVLRFPQPKTPGFTSHFKLFSMVTAGRDSGSFSFELEALLQHIATYLNLLADLGEGKFSFKDIVVEIADTGVVGELCAAHKLDRDEIRRCVRASDYGSAARLLEKYGSATWPADIAAAGDMAAAASHLSPVRQKHLELLKECVARPLAAKFPAVAVRFNLRRLTGLGYYQGPCFHIKTSNNAGQSFMIADGGFVDWTRRLLGDKKERLMTSAIGTELICRMFVV